MAVRELGWVISSVADLQLDQLIIVIQIVIHSHGPT